MIRQQLTKLDQQHNTMKLSEARLAENRSACWQVYSALPFLNELRVITDWTVTETSMNLFMWLK